MHFPAVVSFYTLIHRPNRLLFFFLLLFPSSPLLSFPFKARFSFPNLTKVINKSSRRTLSLTFQFKFLQISKLSSASLPSFYFIRGNFRISFNIHSNGSKWNIIFPSCVAYIPSFLKILFSLHVRVQNFIHRDLYTWVPRSRWIIFRKQCRVSRSRFYSFAMWVSSKRWIEDTKIRHSRSKFVQQFGIQSVIPALVSFTSI